MEIKSVYPAKKYIGKGGNQITVRLALPEDYDEAIDTFGKVASERLYLNTETLHPDIKRIWTERWEKNGEKILFAVAEINGKMAGGAVLNMYSSSPKTDHARELGMWVLKEYRGLGIGNALMEYSIGWTRENGNIRKILLGVWSTNIRAYSLYLKFGFHIDGCHTEVAKIGDSYVDEISMSLDIWK